MSLVKQVAFPEGSFSFSDFALSSHQYKVAAISTESNLLSMLEEFGRPRRFSVVIMMGINANLQLNEFEIKTSKRR